MPLWDASAWGVISLDTRRRQLQGRWLLEVYLATSLSLQPVQQGLQLAAVGTDEGRQLALHLGAAEALWIGEASAN
jgi:hypothetical protein